MTIAQEYPGAAPNDSQLALLASLQQLDQDGDITLWLVDTTHLGGGITRWADQVNQFGEPIVFQDEPFIPVPLQASGFEWAGDGSMPRPKLIIGNVNGAVTMMLESLGGDLVTGKVYRLRLKTRHLDAVNFREGNPRADPAAHFPLEQWEIKQKEGENWEVVTLVLGSKTDLMGVTMPNSRITARTCTWRYKDTSGGCRWVPVPGKYFDVYNQPCTPDMDNCSHNEGGCKLRFGETAVLPARIFVAAAQARR
ncbi:hypothetical protein IGB42_02628 [Andreprevotia sp. IGB-42]|uniref:phage minor tail protein L n=1 Tax=Andreprevotia sp. IGB-42 TaxID=2497473 RepID=UPI0013580B38|nr:phage minor tail protein L [Andreprevotia sp. IGB-42]KAF0812785.1 hypothetical protein IGB42_02628 [Andreprevotia sp. IGB-42]